MSPIITHEDELELDELDEELDDDSELDEELLDEELSLLDEELELAASRVRDGERPNPGKQLKDDARAAMGALPLRDGASVWL